MASLTLAIDDDTLKKARIRALQQDTSVNAVVRRFLRAYAGQDEAGGDGLAAFISHAERVSSGSGPGGRSWTREDIYER